MFEAAGSATCLREWSCHRPAAARIGPVRRALARRARMQRSPARFWFLGLAIQPLIPAGILSKNQAFSPIISSHGSFFSGNPFRRRGVPALAGLPGGAAEAVHQARRWPKSVGEDAKAGVAVRRWQQRP